MIHKNRIFSSNDLKAKDFDNDVFEHCKFVSEISFVNFSECEFKNCDLSQAMYNITSFFKCSFPDSKLSNIDFKEVNIDNCNFENTVMENCVFKRKKRFNLKNVLFNNTKLSGSVFVFCDLENQSFESCDLTLCIYEKCNLRSTSFNNAKIDGCGFENCNIESTKLDINGFVSYGASKGFVLN